VDNHAAGRFAGTSNRQHRSNRGRNPLNGVIFRSVLQWQQIPGRPRGNFCCAIDLAQPEEKEPNWAAMDDQTFLRTRREKYGY
jgi:hypothetical protein